MKVHDNLMKIYETLGKGDEIMQIYRGPEVVECIRLPSDDGKRSEDSPRVVTEWNVALLSGS